MTADTEGAADALRVVRAGVFAAVCVVATTLGHALMSAGDLPRWAVAVSFAGTALGAWWLTGRERSATTVVGATVVAQGLLHLLFTLSPGLVSTTGTARGWPGAAGTSGMGHGMHHPAAIIDHGMEMHQSGVPGAATEAASDLTVLSAVTHGGSVGMLLAHLVAAVACGVWLWQGEAAVHSAGRAMAAALFAPLRRVCRVLFGVGTRREDLLRRPTAVGVELRPPTPASLRHAVVRRGPPRAVTKQPSACLSIRCLP
ncbi:hypothetical protein AB0C98_08830 [Streptomyces sp. NPDC048558]|uniref:hypothetical protein n=1 Tax=Streptomyces sp. NPDC048558 TaxID=3155759 RepID=UPI0033FF3954